MIGTFNPNITFINKQYFIRVIHWFNSVHQNRMEWNDDRGNYIRQFLEHSFEVSKFENISSQFRGIHETYLWMRKEFRSINENDSLGLRVSIYYMQIPIEIPPEQLDELKRYLIQTLENHEITEFVIRTPVGMIDQNQQTKDTQKLTVQLSSGMELIL